MDTHTLIILAVLVALVASVTNRYWWKQPGDAPPPALQFDGVLNVILYIVLVVFLLKLVLGNIPF
jgi:putative copper export protein